MSKEVFDEHAYPLPYNPSDKKAHLINEERKSLRNRLMSGLIFVTYEAFKGVSILQTGVGFFVYLAVMAKAIVYLGSVHYLLSNTERTIKNMQGQ